MTGPAHLRRVLVRSRRFDLVDRNDPVATVTVTAAWRIDQAGQKQRLAMLTGEIAVNQLGRFAVADTTILNLIDLGYR